MTINDIREAFACLEDWEDRFRFLIGLGDAFPRLPEDLKTEGNRIQGCVSQVWMTLGWDGAGRLLFAADSDAQIVRGLIAVLGAAYAGKTAAEAADVAIDALFAELGLDAHLSPNRRNGFLAMVARVRTFVTAARR